MKKIVSIERFRVNGMYRDDYTVFYSDRTYRTYRINGIMKSKHFDFIVSADCYPILNKRGWHVGDRFISREVRYGKEN